MKDSRDPTHVYLDIMAAKTGWNEGILAAADRVENDRRAAGQASVSQAPRDFGDYGPLLEGAPQNGSGASGWPWTDPTI